MSFGPAVGGIHMLMVREDVQRKRIIEQASQKSFMSRSNPSRFPTIARPNIVRVSVVEIEYPPSCPREEGDALRRPNGEMSLIAYYVLPGGEMQCGRQREGKRAVGDSQSMENEKGGGGLPQRLRVATRRSESHCLRPWPGFAEPAAPPE